MKKLLKDMFFDKKKLGLSRVLFAFSVLSPALVAGYLSIRTGSMVDIPIGWVNMAGVAAAAFGVSKGISVGLDKPGKVVEDASPECN